MFFLLITFMISCNDDKNKSTIKVVGQMRDVMWNGDLQGKISTDTINNINAYGLGPIEFLKGEILLYKGKTFISKVKDSLSLDVKEVNLSKAPFFVYTDDSELKEIDLAKNNYSLKSIELYIDSIYYNYDLPLLTIIDGKFENIIVHSVNLPEGNSVSSPSEAHEGLVKYNYSNIKGSIIGFFSRKHKTIFTHHDSFLHAHFISDDRLVMGHVDLASFDSDDTMLKISK